MFTVAGQQGNIPCTATGTNAITLTPGTNFFVPAAYSNAQLASFKAANTSGGSVTLQIGGLALLKLFTAAGVQAGSGDVVANTHYEIQYWADLDSSAGGFIILNATVTAISNPVQGTFKNLNIANNVGTPNTKVDVSVDSIVMQNVSGGTVRSTSVSLTINAGVNGANGLDTGSLANGTFYSIWVIFNANTSTTAGLLSTSATAPTLPAGYTYQARVGWTLTDGSAHFKVINQKGRNAQFAVAQILSSGAAGSTSVPTWVSLTAGTFSPSTAATIKGFVTATTASSSVIAAPNNAYGALSSTSAPPPVSVTDVGGTVASSMFEFVLESANIFWASGGAGNLISVIGWNDNI